VAPGDFHMVVEVKGATRYSASTRIRPKTSAVRRSTPCCAACRGLRQAGGGLHSDRMGSDGCKGSQTVVSAGGTVIAQDEASSVVWACPARWREQAYARRFFPYRKSHPGS